MRRRVLLVGATGTFGRRLAALLADLAGIELVLAARSIDALECLRNDLVANGAVAGVAAHAFDRSRPERLADLSPWLVVDAAGPFQDSDYRLALAALQAGAHYVDLADGRAFVAGFESAVDAAARRSGRLAVTAASSTPALSHAALDRICRGWTRIDDVVVTISPGARAPRGLSVTEAILSYVGRPVRLLQGGRWQEVPGWSGLRTVYMPGLGRRLASICETPDLDLLPKRFGVRRDALFTAGLELAPMHLGLALLSLPVRIGLVPTLRPLARPLRRIADAFAPFGSDRGGMTVEASGRDAEGRPVLARWALWAEADSGPSTPAAPAAAIVRALARGDQGRTGAMPCVGLLDLDEILAELAHLPIRTRIDDGRPASTVMFERLLGSRWEMLPASVREIHGAARMTADGHAVVRTGAGAIVRTVCRLLGFPRQGHHAAAVTLHASKDGETWTRRFGSSSFTSTLADTNRLGLFEERFGPLRFKFDLRPRRNGVAWKFAGWSFAGLPLPLRFGPRIRAGAEDAGGLYRFRVVIALPWFGLLVAYRGTLSPSEAGASASSLKLPS